MADTFKNITVVTNQEGQSLSIAGGTYRIIISGQQTGGAYAVIDMVVPPSGGPVPHAHPAIQESFYVLEGEVEFTTESGSYVAGKGTFIDIPLNGPVHRFKNKSTTTARLLCTVIPAGLEAFFQDVERSATGSLVSPPLIGVELQKKIKALAEQYGQKLYPPDYFG